MAGALHIPAYVDAARLCKELCISERTIDAWVRMSVLPPPKARGGKRLWKWSEVEAYLDEGSPGVAPSADPEAERVRNASKRMAEEASKNRRGHVRRRHSIVPQQPDLCGPGEGDAAELSHAADES